MSDLKRCPCCGTSDVVETYCFNHECECPMEHYVEYRTRKATEQLAEELAKALDRIIKKDYNCDCYTYQCHCRDDIAQAALAKWKNK